MGFGFYFATKSILVAISLVGLFLGLFLDSTPSSSKTTEKQTETEDMPVIDNPYSALAYAQSDDSHDDIRQVHKDQQVTAQKQSDNEAKTSALTARYTAITTITKNSNRLLFWCIFGIVAIAFPVPKRNNSTVKRLP